MFSLEFWPLRVAPSVRVHAHVVVVVADLVRVFVQVDSEEAVAFGALVVLVHVDLLAE